MNTHADKKREHKSQEVLDMDSQMQSGNEGVFGYVDNRSGAIAQRKIQKMANNSHQVSQLSAFQAMANNGSQHNQVVQLENGDMSPSLQDMDDINAIDKKAGEKSMEVTKQEYLREQMELLVVRVDEYAKAMDSICQDGISVLELNLRLKRLVTAGMALSGVAIGLTIATGGAAAPIALAIGLSTMVPGLVITLGKSVTKKQRDKKKKALGGKAANRLKDNLQDGGEQLAGIGAASTEAVGDFMNIAEGALEAGGEIAGMSVSGIGILLGVKDIYDAEKISLAKILGPKFFNEQMMNLENIRARMNQLDSKGGKFPIKFLLSPHIDTIQSSIEKMGSQ